MNALSPREIATAASLWMSGAGTHEIAAALHVTEAAVYNAMRHIREAVSARKPNLKVVC